MFCCEHTQLVHGGVEEGSLGGSEACAQVSPCYSGVWIELCQSRWSGVVGIHRFILGRECSGQEEYFRLLFQFGINYGLMVYKEATLSGTKLNRGQVYGNKFVEL